MKRLRVRAYPDEAPAWPDRGQVILAQYDVESVLLYQAASPGVARRVSASGSLGGEGFNAERMQWFGTSFFWLMHHSAWATAPGQQRTLALWVQRAAFDELLAGAVHSRFEADVYADEAAWQAALDASDVRVQWEADYPAHGPKLRRRAVQLGVRGGALRGLADDWLLHVEDITGFVRQQAEFRDTPDLLFTPAQRIYPVRDAEVAQRLGLDKSVPA